MWEINEPFIVIIRKLVGKTMKKCVNKNVTFIYKIIVEEYRKSGEEGLPEMNDSCDSSAKGKVNQMNNNSKNVCL